MCLLESLEADDRETLKEICEGDLYHKFNGALDMLKEKDLKLKLLNQHQPLDGKIIELVDFQSFAGARIDRALNRENGIKEANPFWVTVPNLTIYMPSNPFKMTASFFGGGDQAKGGPMKIDTLTLELIVAIKSNLKLDLVDLSPDDRHQKVNFLTNSKKTDDEIHFVKFEGRLPSLELSMATVKDQ